MGDGKRPAAVGLFFSLGHCTVVVGLSLLLALGVSGLHGKFETLARLGDALGSLVSSGFLVALAALNIHALARSVRTLRLIKTGTQPQEDLATLIQGGISARIFSKLFRIVSKSWHLYPIGFLFGLGFDTATEIGILGLSAAEAARGLNAWAILIFPALFTGGMALIDTIESIFMVRAYSWSSADPLRRIRYNLVVTAISVFVALAIAVVQTSAFVAPYLRLHAIFTQPVYFLGRYSTWIGLSITVMFALVWGVAALLPSRSGPALDSVEAAE